MPNTISKTAKILIVDDEKANIRLLEIILHKAGYTNVHSTTNSSLAYGLFIEIEPDIVLLDLTMPNLDGFAVMRQLKQIELPVSVPILILTADATERARHQALQDGAMDFLTKPFNETEVLLRIQNLLLTRFNSVLLESKVHERTKDLASAQLETLQRLALAAEYRDDDTGLHTRRVGNTCAVIAGLLGVPDAETELIRRAAPLHDVGKIGIADAILLKPGKLTDEEFTIMKGHAQIGAAILAGSGSPWLQLAEQIALSHHERWDGRGYPQGLAGEAIPLIGRIVTVADVFDALTHERPYKPAWPIADAVAEIVAQSGKQFDERVVQAFMTLDHESLI